MLGASPSALRADVSAGDHPVIEGTTLDGTSVSLEALRGSVVLVDFWASWCRPCAGALELYAGLEQRYSDRGLVVLAVSVDETRGDAEHFAARHTMPALVLWDRGQSLVARFGPDEMPTSFLIDATGQVRHVHEGFRRGDGEAIEERIEELLAEIPSAPAMEPIPPSSAGETGSDLPAPSAPAIIEPALSASAGSGEGAPADGSDAAPGVPEAIAVPTHSADGSGAPADGSVP